jgi:hypothetical protein
MMATSLFKGGGAATGRAQLTIKRIFSTQRAMISQQSERLDNGGNKKLLTDKKLLVYQPSKKAKDDTDFCYYTRSIIQHKSKIRRSAADNG